MWRYDGCKLKILTPEGADYTEVNESIVLPPVTAAVLSDFVNQSASTKRTVWLRSVREWARKHSR